MWRWIRRLLGVIAILIFGLAVPWFLLSPSHDRDWVEDHSVLPNVSGNGPFTVSGIRDWSYDADGQAIDRTWIDQTISPDDLARVWFVVEPFSGHEAVAHTMLSFEFNDGRALVASLEARREVGETYQPIRGGLFPTYEYLIVWATERDMYANTVFWAGDDLFTYPLDLTAEEGQAVLSAMLDLTRDVAAKPRWYSTFFANCTNVLARAMNDLRDGALPFNVAWFLPGYADSYLHELGYFGDGRTFQEAEEDAFTADAVKAVYSLPGASFSTELRRLMGAD